MKPLYITSGLASGLYTMVIVVWVVSEATVLVRTIRSEGVRAHLASNRGQDRLSGPALIGFLLLAVFVGSTAARGVPAAAIMEGRPVIFAFALLLAIAGIVLRWYAIVTLGRFFSMRVQTTSDQQVVQSGPYRLVRHPSYTGLLMTVLGVLLMSTNWFTLACYVIALPGFGYRIYVEEHALASELGDQYRDYMRRSKRLVPFLI
ncbi:MAG TPA: isoprenylcysteine carboxylmethyltransferase family protein [Candidatus Dormibacteraeota bacterium]|nr:isoprenylcysteine carboxylmethyltransferase family protein [Candidatus Dormibacteraeota bacterium]